MLGWMYRFELAVFVFFDIGLELLGHRVVLFLVFWDTAMLFPIATAPIFIPINSVRGFPVLHFLTNLCYLLFSLWWPFWQVWGDDSLWLFV